MFLSGLEDRCVFEDLMYSKLSLYLVSIGYYCNSHTSQVITQKKDLNIVKSMREKVGREKRLACVETWENQGCFSAIQVF